MRSWPRLRDVGLGRWRGGAVVVPARPGWASPGWYGRPWPGHRGPVLSGRTGLGRGRAAAAGRGRRWRRCGPAATCADPSVAGLRCGAGRGAAGCCGAGARGRQGRHRWCWPKVCCGCWRRRGRLAVVVEDLHWADADTLAAVEYLIDHAAAGAVAGGHDVRPEDGGPATALAGRGCGAAGGRVDRACPAGSGRGGGDGRRVPAGRRAAGRDSRSSSNGTPRAGRSSSRRRWPGCSTTRRWCPRTAALAPRRAGHGAGAAHVRRLGGRAARRPPSRRWRGVAGGGGAGPRVRCRRCWRR